MSSGVAEARLFHPTGSGVERRTELSGLLHSLGVKPARDGAVADAIRQGFPVTAVDRLAKELEIPLQRLLRIIALPSATLARRRAKKRLSPQESDRLYRVVAAWAAALRLFEGDAAAARRWLNEPAWALGGRTPLENLDTEAGADEVRDLIGRLEHGVVT